MLTGVLAMISLWAQHGMASLGEGVSLSRFASSLSPFFVDFGRGTKEDEETRNGNGLTLNFLGLCLLALQLMEQGRTAFTGVLTARGWLSQLYHYYLEHCFFEYHKNILDNVIVCHNGPQVPCLTPYALVVGTGKRPI
ncbi:hypothetical protein QBC46DRAFT_117816 [Diplogelasinospora grovesii]|uniref:Uncharacterized protein n=1 Tax=Diplogelasinospora grovesii TaxID=303347 RepID=A0AAN6NKU8_9PEZI|nr:hypothetical protein QBC46DRAFT_117816 [Diplogelasinospora grovesii]